jgi:magnesium-transporting ATPase (P-type)
MDASPLHALRPAEVYEALETSPSGLTREQAAAAFSLYGPNRLAEAPPAPLWRLMAGHVAHPMAILLWIAGAMAFIGRHPVLGTAIWIVVLINGTFSFWQEYRAQKAQESLQHLLPTYARVLRAAEEARVLASEVVPGDVLILAEGDNIPADARVVEEYGLRTNNTTLTGDALPARKTSQASLRDDLTELEQPNLIFAGTSVVSGTGRAVVYATAMLTQFGRIVRLTQQVQQVPSPLQREMRQVMHRISLAAIGLGVFVFLAGVFEVGIPPLQAFLLAIGILVAAIPEGLAPTVTLSLAMAVQRLARRGALVKTLAAIETLGNVSVIATDKSGTLTENQMTIREVWVAGQVLGVSGAGYEPHGAITPDPTGTDLAQDVERLLTAASLCNNSRLTPPTSEHPHWTCLGDQTEAALRVLARKGGLDEDDLAGQYPRLHEVPFDARRKRMSTIHRGPEGTVAFVKGAPREVLALCTHFRRFGRVEVLDDPLRARILTANDDCARRALRVLALAERPVTPGGGFRQESIEQQLTFLGLAAMMDPPRSEVAGAIRTCREAGVRLVMITGDYGLTAESMARRLGMLSPGRPVILTGADVDGMQDAELQARIGESDVIFARMAPEHKLRLVSAFQARGDVVAVIGDGVNDAPALRKADVGISMGIIGTDVAKEAADVILTNDNFGSIATAIAEGRALYDNLRKFITYIFAGNVPEILPFMLTALAKIPLALQVQQILAIDLGTDLLPALALGAEHPEPDVMNRPPRRRDQPLVDRSLLRRAWLWLGPIEAGLCYLGFALVYAAFGHAGQVGLPALPWLEALNPLRRPLEEVHLLATTVFFSGVITTQIGNAFACRTEKGKGHLMGWLTNRWLLFGVAAEVLLALALIYLEPWQALFEFRPLPAMYWIVLCAYAPAVYVLERTRKAGVRFLDHVRQQPAKGGKEA